MGLGGVPISPLQILWMNLVTDGVPALALALEPGESNVMQREPFQPTESIFAMIVFTTLCIAQSERITDGQFGQGGMIQ
jgi:magnesium-transporting ATPase (P-type)